MTRRNFAVLAILSLASSPVVAEVLVSESFDYGTGLSLSGQTGGTWDNSRAWSTAGDGGSLSSANIIAGLTLGTYPVSGNAVEVSSNDGSGGNYRSFAALRQLPSGFSVASGTTLYTSFLFQANEAGSFARRSELVFGNADAAGGDRLTSRPVNQFGFDGNSDSASVGVGGNTGPGSANIIQTNVTYLFINQYTNINGPDFGAGNVATSWILNAANWAAVTTAGISEAALDANNLAKVQNDQSGSPFTATISSNEYLRLRVSTDFGINNRSRFDEVKVFTALTDLTPAPVAPGTFTYLGTGSGAYDTAANWASSNNAGGIPNGAGITAILGATIGAPSTVFTDSNITLGRLDFSSTTRYVLTGSGTLNLEATSGGTAQINLLDGNHKINLPTTFTSNTDINTTGAFAVLTLGNPVSIASGVTLTKNGPGSLTIAAPVTAGGPANLKINGGTVNLDFPNPDGNLAVNVDPATLNIGAHQTLASLTLDLGGNTVNVGQTSSGAQAIANVTTATLAVTNGTGNVVNTVGAGNTVTAASVTIDAASGVSKSGPGTLITNRITGEGSLAVTAGTVRIATGNTTSVVGALSVTPGATIDLTNNAIVVRNGDLAALRAAVVSGLGSGTGLLSSTASPASHTTVAVVLNDAGEGTPFYSAVGTVTGLTSADVLARYTYVGDTDLNGVLNGVDLSNILEGYSTGATGWQNGDIDYDGAVTSADVTTFLTALNLNLPSLGFPGGSASGGGAIPEPSSAAMLVPALALISRRRR